MRGWRTWRSFAAAVLIFAAMPSVASAHGRLKATTPGAGAHLGTAPRELRFDFSEVPDLTFSSVKLIGPDGREIELGRLAYSIESHRTVIAAIPRPLHAGTYVVQWLLAGDDGHPVRGQFDFVIAPGAMGTDDSANAAMMRMSDSGAGRMAMHHDPASMPEGNGFGAESTGYIVVRWVQFIALLLAIGTVSFRQFVLGFLRRRDEPHSPMLDVAEARAAWVGRVGARVLIATLILRLLAQSYAMHGAADVFNLTLSAQMIAKTMWGKGWLLQLGGVILASLGFHMADRARAVRSSDVERSPRSGGWNVASVGILLLAFSPAFSGHAAAAPRLKVLAVVADGLHILGASSWLGSLALVLIAGLPAASQLTEAERGTMVTKLINAFSPIALVSAGLAIVTGVFAAWLHVGTIPNLWGTRYGITLLVKLTVLSVVALTGFYNWRFVKPRLGTDAATHHLVRSARVEVAVAVVVLLVTAVLVATPTSMDATM